MGIIRRILGRIKREVNRWRYSARIKSFGRHSNIIKPLILKGNVVIGDNTFIHLNAWIEANPLTGEKEAELTIGNNCTLGHFNEIYATKSIVIEDNVLTADRVYISDNLHGYQNPEVPVIRQPIKQINTVRIGEGSWLGVGVAVIGAKIGKHCVIGANAVVTHDIPDYCVAVGIPAKVIKKYDFEKDTWVNVC